MSEHWKSTPKYWCKHCSIYVKDTPFERKQHEATGKHQGNLKRFLTGIQKDHARNEREKDKARAEVERLNRLTDSSAASSVAPSRGTSKAAESAKTSSSALSATDQKRQWAQLAEMGIVIPEHARADVAMVGDWQKTAWKPSVSEAESPEVNDKLNVGIRKRKIEVDDEQDERNGLSSRKAWGSTKRTYPGTQALPDDLDALLAGPLQTKARSTSKYLQPAKDATELSSYEHPSEVLPPSNSQASQAIESLDMSDREAKVDTTNVMRPSEIPVKHETSDDEAKPKPGADDAPVFRKRKSKQSATVG